MIIRGVRRGAASLVEYLRPLLPVPQGLDRINPLMLNGLASSDQDFELLHLDQEYLPPWQPIGKPQIPGELHALLACQSSRCSTLLIRSRPWSLRCQHGQVMRSSGRILHDPSTDWPGLYGRSWPLWPARRQRGLVLNLTNHGTPNLYHWLFNPTLQLLRQLDRCGMDAMQAAALYLGSAWPDPWPTYLQQSLSLLGLAALPRLRRAVWPEHLLMSVFASTTVCPSPAQFHWLRRCLAPGRMSGGLRVYLGRAHASRRRLLNERALMAALEPLGFTCVPDPAGLDFQQQCRLLAEADVVVAPHGAALSLLFCCAPGTRLLEIHGPGYISPLYAWMASYGKLIYAGLMAQPRPNPAEPMMNDLWMDPNLVLDQLSQWGLV